MRKEYDFSKAKRANQISHLVELQSQNNSEAKTHFDMTLSVNDFERLKSVAAKQGANYQVVAENILHQYLSQM
jgi:predicted DNA binding CopG/RHH family protein